MIGILILLLVFIALLIGLLFLINWLSSFFNKRFKTVIFVTILSIIIASIVFFLFHSGASNYKTAYLSSSQQGFKVIVKGKRVLMAHDPISIFTHGTYEESAQFMVPRDEGLIKGVEIMINQDGDSGIDSLGSISINSNSMKIDLYYLGDDKKPHRDGWNGDYQLIREH